MVCRSESPSGGFFDQNGLDCVNGNGGTPVLESNGDVYAPGGQGVIYDPGQGSVVMYYHYSKSRFPPFLLFVCLARRMVQRLRREI